MDTTQLALLALLVGVVIGGSVSVVIVARDAGAGPRAAETSLDDPRRRRARCCTAWMTPPSSSTRPSRSSPPRRPPCPSHLERGRRAAVRRAARPSRAACARADVGRDGDTAPAPRCAARGAAPRRRAGDAHLAAPHAARPARHHRAGARRADAPRLRRQHEPRAEDAGRRGQPARRGDRVGRRRSRRRCGSSPRG